MRVKDRLRQALVKLAARKKQISREEIRAIYQQGEDAVIALVEGLLEKVGQLEERIEALENQCKKDSRDTTNRHRVMDLGNAPRAFALKVNAKVEDKRIIQAAPWSGVRRWMK